ncbi:hypothetical protein [Crocosphaera chwakensis]|uniref:hypothetical protein n=1 Tax=Crocosphaera chwakensis TaxID=2546361 RepID=UPI00031EBC29|nr:hypothetical protein [Crocosphaera chwakensis]
MKNLRLTQSIILLTAMLAGGSIASNAYAQADSQDEIRYVQETVEYLYDEDPNQAFTVRELLQDGYKMCKKIADNSNNDNNDSLENLAEDAIRSGLGLGREDSEESQDDVEMMRLAERYLCDS